MARVEMAHVVDLECGEHHRHSSGGGAASEEEEEEGSFCFSDADEGSCYSQFYSTVDGSTTYDDCSYACGSESEIVETADSRRASSASEESDCSVDLEKGVAETKRKIEKDCRICHLSFESSCPEIVLGCSCKGDLASAHKHCAETWFKIKGNKICEICNSIASNVVGPTETETETEPEQQVNEMNAIGANAAPGTTSSTSEARRCWSDQKFLNFLLACMVFAFIISWLFHFNAPS